MSLDLVFPGGGGGNWLKVLIGNLQVGKDLYISDDVEPGDNFHEHPTYSPINLLHTPLENNYLGFSTNGKAWFSIFLNRYYKIHVFDKPAEDMSDFELLQKARGNTLYVLNYPKITVDIEYSNVLTDTDTFIKELFLALDNNCIKYTKDIKIVESSIERYRKSTINFNEHYNNYDSIAWLGWASIICGMFHPHIIYTSHDMHEVAEALQEYHDDVIHKTLNFI